MGQIRSLGRVASSPVPAYWSLTVTAERRWRTVGIRSDFRLLGEGERIIDLDAEIPDRRASLRRRAVLPAPAGGSRNASAGLQDHDPAQRHHPLRACPDPMNAIIGRALRAPDSTGPGPRGSRRRPSRGKPDLGMVQVPLQTQWREGAPARAAADRTGSGPHARRCHDR